MRGKYTSAMADGKLKLTSLGNDVLLNHCGGLSEAQMLHANTDIDNIMSMSLNRAKIRTQSGQEQRRFVIGAAELAKR